MSHIFQTEVVEIQKANYDHPVVIGGFLGPSLTGLVSATYLVEQLAMHQVAHVRSQHIPPAAVFVGGKLRHPFRVYANNSGKIMSVVSEVPIGMEGMYEISSGLLSWFETIQINEIAILDGIPVPGIPEQREAYCVAEQRRAAELKAHGVSIAQSALITGMGGSILNESLVRRMQAISLLTPASQDLPDPGAALKLIETINTVYRLAVPTQALEQSVTEINKNLSVLSDQLQKMREEQTVGQPGVKRTQMYG